MPFYKDGNNRLHWLDSKEFEHLLPSNASEIPDAEAQEIQQQLTPGANRKAEILIELARIDAASTRPARAVAYAIANGNRADSADVAQLGALEAQAQSLRAELKALA